MSGYYFVITEYKNGRYGYSENVMKQVAKQSGEQKYNVKSRK